MSQSLYTAMSGISSATTDLEVISNNVANINTTAFKSSSVNFSDVYSETISYGSVAAGTTGGKNPVQVGVGTQVSSISKNFNTGSATATGKSTDFMIQGAGFFTVESADLKTYYTRAGDFSWDNMGNLVTSDGYKVLGAGSILSTSSSSSTVRVPTSIISVVAGNANIGAQDVSALNNTNGSITEGTFTIKVSDGANIESVPIVLDATTDLSGTVQNLCTNLTAKVNTTFAGPPAYTVSGVTVTAANGTVSFDVSAATLTVTPQPTTTVVSNSPAADASNCTVSGSGSTAVATLVVKDSSAGTTTTTTYTGTVVQNAAASTAGPPSHTITVAGTVVTIVNDDGSGSVNGKTTTTITPPAKSVSTLSFGAIGDTSNFVNKTDLANSALTGGKYTSAILDYTAAITDVTAAAAATSVNSTTINADGSIQATYANGDTLSVKLGADKATYEFVYTTSKGVAISGSSLSVSDTVAVPANFVMQVATITNTDGLISQGSNLFSAGPNSGNIVYTVGNQMGAGAIKSGYLEASNVDLSEELSKMILAQRAVQANSRVFTTVSDTMNTIVQMGR